MVIKKEDLIDVEVNIVEKEIEDLLVNWCMGDYTLFGSVLAEVENIGDRVIFLNYNKDNNSFMTFDKNSNPLSIYLFMDDKIADTRKMLIEKYGYVSEYFFNNFYPCICIDKVKSNNNEFSKKLTRKKPLDKNHMLYYSI